MIALDFYLKYGNKMPDQSSIEIQELRNWLNNLQKIIGGDLPDKQGADLYRPLLEAIKQAKSAEDLKNNPKLQG